MNVEDGLLDVTDVVPDIIPRCQPLQQVNSRRLLAVCNVLVDVFASKDEHPPEMIRVEH